MIKTVIVLDGRIINVGEWDFQFAEIGGEQVALNPLPKGSIEEEREMEYSEDRGWYEAGTIKGQVDSEILGQQMTERELESIVQGQQITDMDLRLFMVEMGAGQ